MPFPLIIKDKGFGDNGETAKRSKTKPLILSVLKRKKEKDFIKNEYKY